MADCGSTGAALDASAGSLMGGLATAAAKLGMEGLNGGAMGGNVHMPAGGGVLRHGTGMGMDEAWGEGFAQAAAATQQAVHQSSTHSIQHSVQRSMEHSMQHPMQRASIQEPVYRGHPGLEMARAMEGGRMMAEARAGGMAMTRMRDDMRRREEEIIRENERLREMKEMELRKAWEQTNEVNSNRGWESEVEEFGVKAATIGELSQAWKEAEEEREAELQTLGAVPPREYEFGPVPKEDITVADPFASAVEAFDRGDLPKAITLLENVVRADPERSEAWTYLGRCHAESDDDSKAIAALDQAVATDPYNLRALMHLTVSCVNEMDGVGASRAVRAWIAGNPQYASLNSTPTPGRAGVEDVADLLEKAREINPADVEVMTCLGVVHNVTKDLEEAAVCLRRATEERPDDYALWNKLGATLANGGHSDDAIKAYHEALKIKPRNARCWLNMAIANSNLRRYDDAARCYLQTLAINPSATHCWSYLRLALTCAERWDLLPSATSHDLDAFEGHFDFVR